MQISRVVRNACSLLIATLAVACAGSSGGGALPASSDSGLIDASQNDDDGGGSPVTHVVSDAGSGLADAQVPATEQPYRVIYWGDYPASGALTATVLDLPSNETRSFELSGVGEVDSQLITRSGKYLVIATFGTEAAPSKVLVFDTSTGASTTLAEGASGADVFDPIALSPDGTRVAYGLSDGTTSTLYATTLTGKGAIEKVDSVMTADGSVSRVSWSQGGRLAVGLESTSSTDFTGVGVVERVGSAWTGKSVKTLADSGSRLVWDDSDNLYFIARDAAGVRSLVRYSAGAGTTTVLTEADAVLAAVTYAHDLELSPDGTHLAFRGTSAATDYDDVYVVDLVKHAVAQLTHLARESPVGDANDVMWSPDSKWLAFPVRWDVPDGELGLTGSVFVVDLDGNMRARLDPPKTTYQVGADLGGFSPDSSTLYLVADARSDGDQELYAIDLDHPPVDAWKTPLLSVTPGHDVEAVYVVP